METQLDEARRRMVQLELLKKVRVACCAVVMLPSMVAFPQENVKLQSEIQAQQSVIEGLKSERRLWGEELAQQGMHACTLVYY
jgi:hypothetical protein